MRNHRKDKNKWMQCFEHIKLLKSSKRVKAVRLSSLRCVWKNPKKKKEENFVIRTNLTIRRQTAHYLSIKRPHKSVYFLGWTKQKMQNKNKYKKRKLLLAFPFIFFFSSFSIHCTLAFACKWKTSFQFLSPAHRVSHFHEHKTTKFQIEKVETLTHFNVAVTLPLVLLLLPSKNVQFKLFFAVVRPLVGRG